MQLPAHIDVNIAKGTFAEDLTDILDGLDEGNGRLAPTFALIDPFGFSGIPYALIRRLIEQRKCEVLINIMVDSMNRFLTHPNEKIRGAITETFGTDKAVNIAFGNGNRIEALKDLYLSQLQKAAKFVRYFEMRDRKNRVIYYLFFASNNPLGHLKMKEAMWKVDPVGEFTFSDATNPNQSLLFNAPPQHHLARNSVRNSGMLAKF
jgi:three-Cys-motif partner protein